jgi:hypothetical protein
LQSLFISTIPHRYHSSRWLVITVGIGEPSPREYRLNQYGRLADALPHAKRRKGLTSGSLSVRPPRTSPVVRQTILVAEKVEQSNCPPMTEASIVMSSTLKQAPLDNSWVFGHGLYQEIARKCDALVNIRIDEIPSESFV